MGKVIDLEITSNVMITPKGLVLLACLLNKGSMKTDATENAVQIEHNYESIHALVDFLRGNRSHAGLLI